MRRFSRTQLLLIVAAVVYIVAPVDFLPEMLTGPLGLVDDAAAAAMLVAILRTPANAGGVTVSVDDRS